MRDKNRYLVLSAEVSAALEEKKAVVALESTIISHGMPYPKNVHTAVAVEEAIRAEGAVPATIAILDGKIHVGLSHEEINLIGREGEAVVKTSRRDLPIVLSKRLNGATTVAATMICAAMAGVHVFATGGVGGVHRGGENSLDISADLEELALSDVLVVCAGVKSILDIGRTLEYLETKGVPVVGFGTETMPAFYTRESGFQVPNRLDSAEAIAAAWICKRELNLAGGMLVANPIPVQDSMDRAYIESQITQALAEADAQSIGGKAITPFLLDRIQKLTGGASLEANIRLVLNNARLAAQIARACADVDLS